MLTRILGDRPLLGGAKMLALCLLVGLALTAIGVDPLHLTRSLQGLMHRAAHIRTGAFQWGWHCFLLGAMLVVPTWLLQRMSITR
jgi:Family of unknown function (DUF6460)